MTKLTKQEAQTKLQAVQERIFELRAKQANVTTSSRQAMEAERSMLASQIQAGYQLLDKLTTIAQGG